MVVFQQLLVLVLVQMQMLLKKMTYCNSQMVYLVNLMYVIVHLLVINHQQTQCNENDSQHQISFEIGQRSEVKDRNYDGREAKKSEHQTTPPEAANEVSQF